MSTDEKDEGDVTIVSSSHDVCEISWKLTTRLLDHDGKNNHNPHPNIIKNIESKPVNLWGCNWIFKLQADKVDKNEYKVILNFEPMESDFWAKTFKTNSELSTSFKSYGGGYGFNKSFFDEEGPTPDGGYEMFSLTRKQSYICFDMEFNWSIKICGIIFQAKPTKNFESLSSDLGKMLENPKGHDVTIQCDGVKMTAHKNILAGRSPVFAVMLESDMKEAKESLVEINEVCPGSVQAMLKWIYTCQISENEEAFAMDIIRLAHMYEMPKLVEDCQPILMSQIKKENVIEILILSDMVGAKEVKNAAIQFIIADKSILQMDEFRKKVNKELLHEITLAALA